METGVQGSDASARVRVAILDYLAHNHDAADTVRGIMNWWLPPEDSSVDRSTVEHVLDQLAAEGFVSATRLADGTVIYRRLAAP
jgi:Fe2+ or Zn2+ uptake regulation protein